MALKAKWLLSSVAASAACIVSVSHAGSAPTDVLQQSTTVHYSDLNLDRTRDVSRLYNRITFAAEQLCGPRSLTGSHSTSPGFSRCFSRAVAQAVTQVNRPQLTVYYQTQLTRGFESATLALH